MHVHTCTHTHNGIDISAQDVLMLHTNHLYADKLPTLDELLILKYMDKGEKKKLRIISEASHKWKNIANLICDGANVKQLYWKKRCHVVTLNECVEQALIELFH